MRTMGQIMFTPETTFKRELIYLMKEHPHPHQQEQHEKRLMFVIKMLDYMNRGYNFLDVMGGVEISFALPDQRTIRFGCDGKIVDDRFIFDDPLHGVGETFDSIQIDEEFIMSVIISKYTGRIDWDVLKM